MGNAQVDYGLLRLRSKDARSAIVQKLATDFNLTPIIAEAFYQQIAHIPLQQVPVFPVYVSAFIELLLVLLDLLYESR